MRRCTYRPYTTLLLVPALHPKHVHSRGANPLSSRQNEVLSTVTSPLSPLTSLPSLNPPPSPRTPPSPLPLPVPPFTFHVAPSAPPFSPRRHPTIPFGAGRIHHRPLPLDHHLPEPARQPRMVEPPPRLPRLHAHLRYDLEDRQVRDRDMRCVRWYTVLYYTACVVPL